MANPIKIARAIESKARKEFGMSKGTTAGKAKVKKRVQNLNEIADYRSGGTIAFKYKKGKLTDVLGGTGSKKVKPRNIGKATKQMAPSKKRDIKSINKIVKNQGKAIKPNVMVNPRTAPKVPVKRRGR